MMRVIKVGSQHILNVDKIQYVQVTGRENPDIPDAENVFLTVTLGDMATVNISKHKTFREAETVLTSLTDWLVMHPGTTEGQIFACFTV